MPGSRIVHLALLGTVFFACSEAPERTGALVASSGPEMTMPRGGGEGGHAGDSGETDPAPRGSCDEGGVDCEPVAQLEPELCDDGHDNDGDGRFDCEDPDCFELCEASCETAVGVPISVHDDTLVITGTTLGAVSDLNGSCGPLDTDAPERVFAFEATESGVLDASLLASSYLSVSLRSACGDIATESVCASEQVSAVVSASETVYLVVDGATPGESGSFDLEVKLRAGNECGDGWVEGGETCDDGGVMSGDGCDASCQLENDEQADNGSTELAQELAWDEAFFGSVSSDADDDFFEFVVPASGGWVTLSVDDFDSGGCAIELPGADPALEVVNSLGDPVAWDSDGGLGECSELSREFSAGTYFVRVFGESSGSFPYRLRASLVLSAPAGD